MKKKQVTSLTEPGTDKLARIIQETARDSEKRIFTYVDSKLKQQSEFLQKLMEAQSEYLLKQMDVKNDQQSEHLLEQMDVKNDQQSEHLLEQMDVKNDKQTDEIVDVIKDVMEMNDQLYVRKSTIRSS